MNTNTDDFHTREIHGVIHVNGDALFCGDRLVGVFGDEALAERINELLNTYGLVDFELAAQEGM